MTTSARRMRRSSHGGRWSWFPRTPVRVREPREARCSFGRRRSSARLAIPGKRWPPTGLRLPSTGGGSRPSGCLELDAIRRPVPSTEAPCQHRGRTAVRSRRQGFWPFPASAKRTGGSLVGVGSAQEGSRPGRHAEPGSTPRAATRSGPLPNLARFAHGDQRGHRARARRDTASAAVAGPADPDAGSAAAARPGPARRAGSDPAARHLRPCRTGARLTAAPSARFRCSPPPRWDASRTRALRTRGT